MTAPDPGGTPAEVSILAGDYTWGLMALLDEHLQAHVVSSDDPAERAEEAQVLVKWLRAYGR